MQSFDIWSNTTKWQREYSSAIKAATAAVDRARATKDAAFDAVEDMTADEAGKAKEQARKDFNRAVNNVHATLADRMSKLTDRISSDIAAAYTKAPTIEQQAYLNMLRDGGRITLAEVHAAFDAVEGNAVALKALCNILQGMTTETGYKPSTPFDLFTPESAERTAKRVTGEVVRHIYDYANGSLVAYLSTDSDTYNKGWSELCYWLEFIGA